MNIETLLEAAAFIERNERRDRGKFTHSKDFLSGSVKMPRRNLPVRSFPLSMRDLLVRFLAEDEHGYATTLPKHEDYPRRRLKTRKSQGNR